MLLCKLQRRSRRWTYVRGIGFEHGLPTLQAGASDGYAKRPTHELDPKPVNTVIKILKVVTRMYVMYA